MGLYYTFIVGVAGSAALIVGLVLFALSQRWSQANNTKEAAKHKKSDDAPQASAAPTAPGKAGKPMLPTPRRAPFVWLFSLSLFFLLHGGCAALGALAGSGLYGVLAYFNQLEGWVPPAPTSK